METTTMSDDALPRSVPPAAPAGRFLIGALPVDPVTLAGALDEIERLVNARQGGTVFTPNVDHVVIGEHDARFRTAYQSVSLSLVDGMPLVWAARVLGHPVPEKVSGSDLVMPLVERAAARHWRVFLLGGAPGVGDLAVTRLKEQLPGIQIVGTDSPRIKLDEDPAAWRPIAARIAETRPDLVMVALGAPKQELFSTEMRSILSSAVMVCVGAGIDFIAGTLKRAPAWMSRSGLEWLYRLSREPKRLAGRYLVRDPQFVFIFGRQLGRKLMGGKQVTAASGSTPSAPSASAE
jgi:N-acetylglucosaminyldiphosphoundecaprenol N-acetyl-beta-D-mannosaminyltransferase